MQNLIGIEPNGKTLLRGRLSQSGHFERMEENSWVKRCVNMNTDRGRGRGKPRKTREEGYWRGSQTSGIQ